MLIALLLAATPAANPPVADAAGHRLEALAPRQNTLSPAGSVAHGMGCTTPETWCFGLVEDPANHQWRLDLIEIGSRVPPRRIALPEMESGTGWYTLWPNLVRERGGALIVGVEQARSTSYAGGGASVRRLLLFRAEPGAEPVALLDAPAGGSATIRACFSQADRRDRGNACADQYEMGGSLTLDPANAGERPRFILNTTARTYPGHVTRDGDSSARGRLSRRDLAWWNDPICSYRRTFAFDAATGRYAPDAPLPECRDYLDIGD